jgi:hypothetical protein
MTNMGIVLFKFADISCLSLSPLRRDTFRYLNHFEGMLMYIAHRRHIAHILDMTDLTLVFIQNVPVVGRKTRWYLVVLYRRH